MAAFELMERLNYDHAPVLVGGRPSFWVAKEALAETAVKVVGDATRSISPDVLVSGDASLSELLEGLQAQPFLFVFEGRSISGVITTSDLNKQPARTYFFLRIAEFESRLAAFVRERVGDDEAYLLLPNQRRGELETVRARARRDNLELGWISYFYLSDLLEVVRRNALLRAALGDPDERHWNNRTEGLAGVRNAAVHLVRDLVDSGRSAAALSRIDINLTEAPLSRAT